MPLLYSLFSKVQYTIVKTWIGFSTSGGYPDVTTKAANIPSQKVEVSYKLLFSSFKIKVRQNPKSTAFSDAFWILGFVVCAMLIVSVQFEGEPGHPSFHRYHKQRLY